MNKGIKGNTMSKEAMSTKKGKEINTILLSNIIGNKCD